MLLKSVAMTKAHVAECDYLQQRFGKTVNVIISNTHPSELSSIHHPTWKTLYERFKKILADHRASATNGTGSAELGEEVRKRTQLLEDIVLKVNEAAEIRRFDREERRQREGTSGGR